MKISALFLASVIAGVRPPLRSYEATNLALRDFGVVLSHQIYASVTAVVALSLNSSHPAYFIVAIVAIQILASPWYLECWQSLDMTTASQRIRFFKTFEEVILKTVIMIFVGIPLLLVELARVHPNTEWFELADIHLKSLFVQRMLPVATRPRRGRMQDGGE